MAGIIIDTNVISELMRAEPEPLVLEWFARQKEALFYITAITQAEILLGISLLPASKRRDALSNAAMKMFQEDFAGNCLPFNEFCTALYASIVSTRRRSGFTTTTEDAQIAAIALNNKLPLATRNIKDFIYIDGLTIYNPWDALNIR